MQIHSLQVIISFDQINKPLFNHRIHKDSMNQKDRGEWHKHMNQIRSYHLSFYNRVLNKDEQPQIIKSNQKKPKYKVIPQSTKQKIKKDSMITLNSTKGIVKEPPKVEPSQPQNKQAKIKTVSDRYTITGYKKQGFSNVPIYTRKVQ